jgi:hypothetical protein
VRPAQHSSSFAQAVLLQLRHFLLLLVQPRLRQQSARVAQDPLPPTHAPSAQVPLPRQEACAQQAALEMQTLGLVQDASATTSFAAPPVAGCVDARGPYIRAFHLAVAWRAAVAAVRELVSRYADAAVMDPAGEAVEAGEQGAARERCDSQHRSSDSLHS